MKHSDIFKKVGLSFLLVPVSFLLFFGIGELMRGVSGGVMHFVQLMPLLVLFVIALFNSEWAGYLLIVIGAILGLLYILNTHFSLSTILVVEGMLFVMPVVSGIFLLISDRLKNG